MKTNALGSSTSNTGRTALANIDVRGLVGRLDRMRMELRHAQSADMPNGLLPADAGRLLDYIADYKRYWEYVQTVPIPDTPEAHGVWTVPIPDDSDVGDANAIENDDIRQLLMQMEVYRLEMVNSQSARLTQGFIPIPAGQPSDRQRFSDAIIRIENFANYIAASQPSDRPESTPLALPTPPGRMGT